MVRVAVVAALVASSLVILAFMAWAWANIRQGRRVRGWGWSGDELKRLRQEFDRGEPKNGPDGNDRGRPGT
jgi:hypothetical protein